MKIVPDCTPCALRRLLATAQQVTDDPWLHDKVLAQAMGEMIEGERDVTPAERMCDLHDLVCRNLGVSDPWGKEREAWMEQVAPLAGALRERLEECDDPLPTALLAAARANAFDDELLPPRRVREELRRIGLGDGGGEPRAEERFAFSDLDRFRRELAEAGSLLFIHDSAPELVFDIGLIESLRTARPDLEVTSVVRAQPVLLDATHEDAERAALSRVEGVRAVVDPGVGGLGITLGTSSREFRELFEESDLVLAKGQAHLETLSESGRAVYFLLRVKCAVMARHQGCKIGELVFVRA